MPSQFEAMKERVKNNQDIYIKKLDMRESLQKMLVPAKDSILKKKSCGCGPNKLSGADERVKLNHDEWSKRITLKAINNAKKIELMNFYNKKLSRVKFTRDSVMHDQSNTARERGQNLSVLERKDT